MLIMIGAILFFLFVVVPIGFGVYEFVNEEVTNGLLSFILSVITLNLALNWMVTFKD